MVRTFSSHVTSNYYHHFIETLQFFWDIFEQKKFFSRLCCSPKCFQDAPDLPLQGSSRSGEKNPYFLDGLDNFASSVFMATLVFHGKIVTQKQAHCGLGWARAPQKLRFPMFRPPLMMILKCKPLVRVPCRLDKSYEKLDSKSRISSSGLKSRCGEFLDKIFGQATLWGCCNVIENNLTGPRNSLFQRLKHKF